MSGPYRTLVVDPPWEYGEGFPSGVGRERRWTAELPYQSMTLDELSEVPVADMADPEGARLFLWATNKYLRIAFDVMDWWGFRYGQTITWHKTGCPSPFPTSVAPQHSEFLLCGSRGKPPRRGEPFPSTVIAAGRSTQHSAKPDLFIDLIERLSPSPYAELFSRRARFGWEYPIGDQALGGVAV